MYQVMKYDVFNGWTYMNSFKSYADALEACREYKRLYRGQYEVRFSD